MSGGDQNWQVGDLALCVSDDGFDQAFVETGRPLPTVGSVNQVMRCTYEKAAFLRHRSRVDTTCVTPAGIWPEFQDFGDMRMHSSNFRKISPHAPDAEDAETIALLNSAPVPTPELV